jgi:internalin A
MYENTFRLIDSFLSVIAVMINFFMRLIGPSFIFLACQEAPTPPTGLASEALYDHTIFADRSLESAVRDMLNQKKGMLSQEDLSKIENFDGSELLIEDLKGIEQMSGLRRLNLGGNFISNIEPLASLEKLQHLDLSDNIITSLDALSELGRLYSLDISSNKLDEIESLQGLSLLTYLNLRDNKVQDLTPLSNLRRLKLISLDNNEVHTLEPLMGLRLLTDLELSGNPLDDLGQLNIFEGRGVRANYYEPYENPFDPAIEEDIRRALGSVKGPLVDKLLEKLTLFNATGPIQSLSGMGRLVNVESLFIRFLPSEPSAIPFSDLTPLSLLTNLKMLTIRDTAISDLVPIGSLKNLTSLSLPNTDLSSVVHLSPLSKLEFLNLAENSIYDVSSLTNMNRLITLNLTGNEVVDLSPLLKIEGIKSIWIRRNPLSIDSRTKIIPALRERGTYVAGP